MKTALISLLIVAVIIPTGRAAVEPQSLAPVDVPFLRSSDSATFEEFADLGHPADGNLD